MKKFQILHDRVKKSGSGVAEALCRKYLAETPNDLLAWNLLFEILTYTKNYKELVLLVGQLISAHSSNQLCLILCIRYLLYAGDYAYAKKILAKVNFEDSSQYTNFLDDLYHLAVLAKIESNKITPALDFQTMNQAAHEFNKKSLKLNNDSSVQVVCYLQKSFHYVIQSQIASELLKKGIKVLFSNSLWFVKAAKPRVLLVSEALYENILEIRNSNPNILIVNTRHGLGDKNHAAIGASQSDRICVSSESVAEIMINETITPKHKIWVTGYPQMDELFNNLKSDREKSSASTLKTVIFAPTFNRYLSSAYLLKEDLVKSIRGNNKNIRVIVKPHPHLLRDESEMIKNWLNESKVEVNVFIDTNPSSNIMDYFHKCDLMVSDVSSAALAWFAVNKPLICLINHEIAETSENYSDHGLEWRMHEASTVVTNVCELSSAVNQLLINPGSGEEKRKNFSGILFGNLTDGKASERVAMNIIEFLKETSDV